MNPESGNELFLKEYGPGDVFGELALLYNAPRAASITALTDCQLLSLDRSTFNHVVRFANVQKRNLYQSFISQIEILFSLSEVEKLKICDCLEAKMYKENENIVVEGEMGSNFYIIQSGTADAWKLNPETGKGTVWLLYHLV